MADMLHSLPKLRCRNILLCTRNRAAVLTLKKPRQQSGQRHTHQAYQAISRLRREGNSVIIAWLPTHKEDELMDRAKKEAKTTTRLGAEPRTQMPGAKSTKLNLAWAKRSAQTSLPERVGQHSKRVDTALPGKHTRRLYDRLSWKEASVLAQLRTGKARLNEYLYQIKAAPTDQCDCGCARETVEHFLFRCSRWAAYRTDATVYRHPQEQLVLLLGRKVSLRRQVLVSRHGGRSSNDTICDGHGPTGCVPINP